jgi:hypothetical protein
MFIETSNPTLYRVPDISISHGFERSFDNGPFPFDIGL